MPKSSTQLNLIENTAILGKMVGVDKANKIIEQAITVHSKGNVDVANVIIKSVCTTFDVTEDYIKNSKCADGYRIYILGICWNLIVKHTILNHPKISELLNKPKRNNISTYANMLDDLCKLPQYSKFIEKYYQLTKQLDIQLKK